MDRKGFRAFLAGLALVIITATFNIGFIAIDDYAYTVAVVVPAERHTTASIIPEVNFRSPLPSILLHELANVARNLGIEMPTMQYAFILLVLGVFSFTVVFWCSRKLYPGSSWILSLYFLTPLLLTRTMYESLTIPYLMISLFFATRYWEREKVSALILSAFFLAVASLFRFHVGLCFGALVVLPALRKKWVHLIYVIGAGALFFALCGIPDLVWKGEWHKSLFDYFAFNRAHSHEFGVTPFYTYVILLLGVTLPPALFMRVRNYPYWRLMPALLYFAFFVGIHSMIGHKEERFMIPMIPIFLVLLAPVVAQAFEITWRRYYVIGLNTLLLFIVCLNEPQSNVISLVRFLDRYPTLSRIVTVDDTLVLYPEAFIRKPPTVVLSDFKDAASKADKCDVIVIRADLAQRYGSFGPEWRRTASFSPGFAEALMVKMNPKHNGRRGPIELWRREGCWLPK